MGNIQTLNDIKKILYKDNPVAEFDYIRKGYAYYKALVHYTEGESPIKVSRYIPFMIPIADMGDADFKARMDAKHLIRWIIIEEKEEVNL